VAPGCDLACLQALPLETQGGNNAFNVNANTTFTFDKADKYHFGHLTVKSGATLIFDRAATLYVENALQLAAGATIVFQGSTPSAIHLDSKEPKDTNGTAVLVMDGGAVIKSQESAPGAVPMPEGVAINVTNRGGRYIRLRGGSATRPTQIYGSLYTPFHDSRALATMQGVTPVGRNLKLTTWTAGRIYLRSVDMVMSSSSQAPVSGPGSAPKVVFWRTIQ